MNNKEDYINCVYLITNDFDDKKYIGVTKNLKIRINQHKNGHDKEHSYIDKSIAVHGWEHFQVEIIDHYNTEEERRELEKRYIQLYNSMKDQGGYNLTHGGEDLFKEANFKGSANPRAQLNEEDVKNIRIRRMNGERMSTVYEDYKDKLEGNSRAGFSKVWLHDSWPDICAEFKGKYPPVNTKHYASIKKNELTQYDLDFLKDYYKWYGPIAYSEPYKMFKGRVDWPTFQAISKQIVEELYGPKSTRRYQKQTGLLDLIIEKNRKELKEEPKYYS